MTTAQPLPTRRAFLSLGAGAAAFCATPSVLRAAPALRQATGRAFGSAWRIALPDHVTPDLRPLDQILTRIDRQMSPWRTDSEVSRFNRAVDHAAASPATVTVAAEALRIAAQSEGAFDPSVGPLVRRWGYGPIEGDPVGWQGLAADGDRLSKQQPGQTMDLCGIAKGYAVDRLADALRDQGAEDFLLDIGGELRAEGRHPSGRPWQAGVEDPRPGRDGLTAAVRLEGRAIATSGLRAQSYDLAGQRYGHIMDPHSGLPVAGRMASVSVLAGQAMLADGWATALAAAGDRGPDLARRIGLDALFLFDDADELRRELTGDFARYLL